MQRKLYTINFKSISKIHLNVLQAHGQILFKYYSVCRHRDQSGYTKVCKKQVLLNVLIYIFFLFNQELHTSEKTKLITQLGDAKKRIEWLEQEKVKGTGIEELMLKKRPEVNFIMQLLAINLQEFFVSFVLWLFQSSLHVIGDD